MNEGQRVQDEGLRARLAMWRQAHPQATFDQIEDAVQQELARYQAQLVDELIQSGQDGAGDAAERPVCATCGERMRPCGRRAREVLCRLGRPVQVERAYYVCPACGAGLFPPR